MSKDKLTLEDILRIERRIRREEFIEEGAYDGRLAPRRHKDKKKNKNKYLCRKAVEY